MSVFQGPVEPSSDYLGYEAPLKLEEKKTKPTTNSQATANLGWGKGGGAPEEKDVRKTKIRSSPKEENTEGERGGRGEEGRGERRGG